MIQIRQQVVIYFTQVFTVYHVYYDCRIHIEVDIFVAYLFGNFYHSILYLNIQVHVFQFNTNRICLQVMSCLLYKSINLAKSTPAKKNIGHHNGLHNIENERK